MNFWITIFFFSTLYTGFIGWMMMSFGGESLRAEIDQELSTWRPEVDYEQIRWLYLICCFMPILSTCLLLTMVKMMAGVHWDNLFGDHD